MRFWGVIGAGLLLALSMGLITSVLTGRTEVRSVPFQHDPVEERALALQRELDRLYLRYEDRLTALSAMVSSSRQNTFALESTAARLVGVRTITWLPFSESGNSLFLEVRNVGEGELPYDPERFARPVFSGGSAGSVEEEGRVRQIDPGFFEGRVGSGGWLPGGVGELFRWVHPRPEYVVLIGLDQRSVGRVTGEWLAENEAITGGLSELVKRSGAAAIRLVGPDNSVIAEAGVPPKAGGEIVRSPASMRFGTWTLEALAKTEVIRSRDWPWFIAGQAVALTILAGAVLLAIALRRANRVARQRVSFVNRASHELRTPITNMMLNVDLAREMIDDDPDGAEGRLERVSDEAGRLSRLVDNLLTFSRSENGTEKVHLVTVDPSRILIDVLDQFGMSLRDRKIDVSHSPVGPIEVEADPDALTQVFGNLLSNVEKYAAGGNKLELTESIDQEKWHVEFRDFGPGIPERRREKIFEPFQRSGDAINEGVSGTGLGLTIARDLCRRMRGDLQLIESSDGAVFRVTLPLTHP